MSRLFTHFSILFPPPGSEYHIFCLWGLASLLCFPNFLNFFFISVHLPLWLLVVCNSTHFTMLIKTLQTRSLLDLYFVYLIWNSSFVKVNQHLHRSAVSTPELHWFMFWFLPISSHYTSSDFISNEETLTCTYNGKKFFQSLKDEPIYRSVSF